MLGDTLGISSAHDAFFLPLRDCCLHHGSDGTWSEANEVIYSSSCFPVWVQWGERKGQDKLGQCPHSPSEPLWSCSGAVDTLEFIIFCAIFMYILNYWYLVAFFLGGGVLFLWLHGVFSSEREQEEQAEFGYEQEVWILKVSPGARFPCPSLSFSSLQNITFGGAVWGRHQHLIYFHDKHGKEPQFLMSGALKCPSSSPERC